MKLFGLAIYMNNWLAFCFGKKAWVCKIIWSPVKHKFCWFHFSLTSEEVWYQRTNSNPYRFFGMMILSKENIYDLED